MENAQKIFDRYEAIRSRLPQSASVNSTKKIGSLQDIVKDVDAFVFDAFGVLNVGETLIPGADLRLRQLRQAGCLIRVLTNAASYNRSGAIAKFEKLGIELDASEIITSRDAALKALDNRHWGVIAAPEDDLSDLPARVTRLDGDPTSFDSVDGILFLSSAAWSDALQSGLEASLKHRPRLVIIANADLVAPRGQGFSIEPGFFGHRIADHTGAEVRFFGKPFADVYELAQETLKHIRPDRIAMCGDTLHTDILGATAFGWQTVLVTRDGLFAGTDVDRFVNASKIFSSWQLERI